MTNLEKLQSMPIDELGDYFCEMMEIISDKTESKICCGICPVEHLCAQRKNGFVTWLKAEAK